MRVDVAGADTLARTSTAAARRLADLTRANRAVAEGVRRAAAPPRRTGRLAGSLTVDASPTTAEVFSTLAYAGVIEHGWRRHRIAATRFLERAATARTGASLDLYAGAVDDALATVRGV